MTDYGELPSQAVLALGATRIEDLERDAARAGHGVLRADCSGADDKAGVLEAIGRGFGLPAYFGQNLDALYDCLTDLVPPAGVEQPGFLVILRDLPDTAIFDSQARDALLAVFSDGAEHFRDRGIAFRVFHSVRRSG
jgi:RNAse (barnase) inhibitor barstar